jgi:hypothetical protein
MEHAPLTRRPVPSWHAKAATRHSGKHVTSLIVSLSTPNAAGEEATFPDKVGFSFF